MTGTLSGTNTDGLPERDVFSLRNSNDEEREVALHQVLHLAIELYVPSLGC